MPNPAPTIGYTVRDRGMRVKRRLFTLLLALVATAGPACAASDAAPAAAEMVVVTARPPDPVGNEAFSTVVLDQADLLLSLQLDEALKQIPGFSLFRRNSSLSANPTTQGASLRAIAPSGAGRSLVTLDGVPQNDPFGGWVIWSALPPEGIARAEIVRGAGSGPYGSGALTGVIALSEQSRGLAGDLAAGELGTRRAAAAGGASWGNIGLFASAAAQTSDGWIPVRHPSRGVADDEVTLDAYSGSLRLDLAPSAGTAVSARAGFYDEQRDSGLDGAASQASGQFASVSAIHRLASELALRGQAWVRASDFSMNSVSVAVDRSSTTPTNEQYATPALGFGLNAALRGNDGPLAWEVGGDMRSAAGESRERFSFISGAFSKKRAAGGHTVIAGLYAEGAHRADDWLFTAGVRADYWSTDDGHLREQLLADGGVTLDEHPPSRHGVVPTARVGARKKLGGLHLRSAAYAGFRVPTLNELYRPFRLGNNVTQANAALQPEKLYGVEAGAGGEAERLSWEVTLFWNQLHSAITNVTIAQGPGTFPGVGFIPAGGLLIQRRNAGDIDAYGIEGEARFAMTDQVSLWLAGQAVDARVAGGEEAPQLTGKRPAQAPPWTVTAGLTARPLKRLDVSLALRCEGARFTDDLNTLRLGSSTTVTARVAWRLTETVAFYVAADNVFDAAVASTQTADHVVSYDAPRIVRIGISVGGFDLR